MQSPNLARSIHDQLVEDVKALPETQQQIIGLRFEQGLNMHEVAAVMEMTLIETFWHYNQAINSLRPSLNYAAGGEL